MKRLAFILFAIAVLAILTGAAVQLATPIELSASDHATFARANQLYEAEQFAAAINLYEQLTARGVINADLYFNLGQAYAQLGKANQAAEWYQRAAQLAPRDGQITARLHQLGVASRGLPLASNEVALLALLAASAIALIVVGRRRGVFARQSAARRTI
jgi:tetratricopeptide (TPR) repeat protein